MRIGFSIMTGLLCLGWLAACGDEAESDGGNARSIPMAASRITGVAPLLVHFHAAIEVDANGATPAFHEREHAWDFGDPGSGHWGTSGKSRNNAKGPVAAHLYETPGTYQARLTVHDAAGSTVAGTFTITVTDPDTVYAGENTVCVSDTAHADFDGAPAGARLVTTDDLSEVTGYALAGTRILFRRGSSWTTGNLAWPEHGGPLTIGAYGPGADPDAAGRFANAPRITVTNGTFLRLDRKQDWRVTDLVLLDPTRTHAAFGGASEMQRFLFHRLVVRGFANTLGWSHWNTERLLPIDQMAIVDCEIAEGQGNVVYVGAERLAMLGNTIRNARESHVVRIWQAHLSVISGNLVSGASLDSGDGRHALKLHGPGRSSLEGVNEYGTPVPESALLGERTGFTVISDNVFGSSGPWPVTIGPQDGLTDAALSHLIFERNRVVAGYGETGSRPVAVALLLWGRHFSVRNNIFDGSGAGGDFRGILVERRGVEPAPRGIALYHNTIYRGDNGSGNERYGICIGPDAVGTLVKNNLASFPAAAVPTILLQDRGRETAAAANLLLPEAGFFDAGNPDPLVRDFRLGMTSAARGQGEPVPVHEDYAGNPRDAVPPDCGAGGRD